MPHFLIKNEDINENLIRVLDPEVVLHLVSALRIKKGEEVNVILYKNMIASYYNVPISKRPYTALCVDVFTEEENQNGIVVTKYINNVGLYDNFSIYVEIDGTIYKTDQYVNFY